MMPNSRTWLRLVAALVVVAPGCGRSPGGTGGSASSDAAPTGRMQVEAYVEEANDAEILDLIEVIRLTMGERFLTPDPRTVERYGGVTSLPGSGLNRILERGRFEGLTPGRGGGAYFSFTTRSNDYNRRPHLALERGTFSSAFAGRDCGCVQAIGTADIATMTVEDCPDALRMEDAFEFCEWSRDIQCHRTMAQVGRTYAVRAIRWNENDLLVVFTVVERDDLGLTFVWRILREFAPPIRGRESEH